MAFLWARLRHTSSATDLNRKFLTLCISNKLSLAFVHILGRTGRFINCAAHIWASPITNFFQWSVTLFNSFSYSLLFKGDLANLLEVLLARFFLCRFEICNISIVTFFNILMLALQDWIFGQSFHAFFLDNTQTTISSSCGLTEINTTRNGVDIPS